MTASSKKADLLNSIYDWYQSKTQRSENTCSPKAKIETNIITYSPISQTESFLIRQSLSPSLPKTKKITRSDLLNLMKHKHEKMLKSEMISLKPTNTDHKVIKSTSNRFAFSNKHILKSHLEIDNYINLSVRNEPSNLVANSVLNSGKGKVPKFFDFRSSSHKSRFLDVNKSEKKVKIPLRLPDVDEITKIKQKMAVRNQPISSKLLELGLSRNQEFANDDRSLIISLNPGTLLMKNNIKK